MKVRTSHDTIEDFSKHKIVRALVNEANAPILVAEKIANEVESYLTRIGVSPTTTMIREMVNAKLIEYGFDEVAARHQRLGLPIYDVRRILTQGDRMDTSTRFNPESIHKQMGDMIARNYALSSVIPTEIADAHRSGLIHIHDLEYFVTRPYCFAHDLRYFLLHGLKVDGSGRDTAVAGPARHPEVAIFHAAKALAASQVFWSGGQAYNYFNVLMAPYVAGRSEREIRQLCQMFVYEMSQQYVARGGQMVLSSVSLLPGVPTVLGDSKAVKPGGVLGPETYSDFHDESVELFRQLINVLLSGDYAEKPFRFPEIEIKLDGSMIRSAEEEYLSACMLASKYGSPIFMNLVGAELSPLSCSVEPGIVVDGGGGDDLRGGALQEVTVNLPRVALDSQNSEARFYEILGERMELARRALSLKRDILRQRMEEGSLSFAAQRIGDSRHLEIDEQHALIGVLGLNEACNVMTGSELHESDEARGFAIDTLEAMNGTAREFSNELGVSFRVCQSPSVEASSRLAIIDRRKFRGRFFAQGEGSDNSLHYTRGAGVSASAEVPLEERIEIGDAMHRLLPGGAILDLWLDNRPPAEVLFRQALEIANSGIQLFCFTQDLTLCLGCESVHPGLARECRACGSKAVDWISRMGRISRAGITEDIGGWGPGSIRELLNRQRYRL